jgi:hypothetical protein
MIHSIGEGDPMTQQAQAAPVVDNKKGAVVIEEKKDELCVEIEMPNTDHHKQIVKARNEYYQTYKKRFEQSIRGTMGRFDELRKEELRFNVYWLQNLKQITMKHI